MRASDTVALAIGLQQGEALDLRWDDVDQDAGTLSIRNALKRLGPGWELVEPKTTRSRRSVALPAVVLAALRQHRTRQLEERLWAGSRWQEHGFVFTSTIGTPLDGSGVSRRFHAALEAARCPRDPGATARRGRPDERAARIGSTGRENERPSRRRRGSFQRSE